MSFLPIALMEGEKITGTMGGNTIAAITIIGLAVVFAGLLILILYLYLSGAVFRRSNSADHKPEPTPKARPAAQVAPVKQVSKSAAAEDESEVVAAIMAAIAAMGAADGKTYRVRSVKPVHRGSMGRSAWAQAGLSDNTTPF